VTNSWTTPDTDTDAFTRNLADSNYQGSASAGYVGYLGGISGNVANPIVNFYDENDSAITTWWNLNNHLFKPNTADGYEYNPDYHPPGQRLYLVYDIDEDHSGSRIVTDPAEAKAYVDQSLTGTIGSNAGLYGAVAAQVSEDAMGQDHGYESNNPIQDPTTFSFYNDLMESYGLIPIQMP